MWSQALLLVSPLANSDSLCANARTLNEHAKFETERCNTNSNRTDTHILGVLVLEGFHLAVRPSVLSEHVLFGALVSSQECGDSLLDVWLFDCAELADARRELRIAFATSDLLLFG